MTEPKPNIATGIECGDHAEGPQDHGGQQNWEREHEFDLRDPSHTESLSQPLDDPPTSPTGKDAIAQAIPRLIPELEEPKWHLLEGGQACCEMGVADSGGLVGLPNQELEESFETLETMAGEISGSVFIVKQIDVLPLLSGLPQSQPERWEGRKRKRRDMLGAVHELS
ncbi:hypothetical protein SCLCIDRAFT_33668 [Scleroderma citrinum Foug A]|uniref:Uncharacterized protein n=1 Tax=Scleroderma citrinum Foug A TaxID=1036808 RepID=A0A0C3D452_9AGAM|nr:hypothetical protein SCLCIDRAFT_33668 [Scleroderma citrinum Foug A]